MKVTHINCGTLCPLGCQWITRGADRMVCHCLIIETNRELILVDTGFGMADCLGTDPARRNLLLGQSTVLNASETAVSQVRALGYDPRDVRHIIPTHLDADHCGGLADFPEARVHILRDEYEGGQDPKPKWLARFRVQKLNWAHDVKWEFYETPKGGELWNGFEAIRTLRGVSDEVFMVPLIGHTFGHTGVGVKTDRGHLLHAGDSYFYRGEVETPPTYSPALSLLQKAIELDRPKRLLNQERLRQLKREKGSDINIFCAHDPFEFDRLALNNKN